MTFRRALLPALSAVVVTSVAHAGDYLVRVHGTVTLVNPLVAPASPFTNPSVGDAVVCDLDAFAPPASAAPGSATWLVDRATSQVSVGAQSATFSSAHVFPAAGDMLLADGSPDSFGAMFGLAGGSALLNLAAQDDSGAAFPTWDLAALVGTSATMPPGGVITFLTNGVPLQAAVTTIEFLPGLGGGGTGSASCDGTGACPCGNSGPAGSGCVNSLGVGASLSTSGSPSLANDTLSLVATLATPGQPAMLVSGTNLVNGGAGLTFGDGLRCVGGTVRRLGVLPGGAAGFTAWPQGTSAISQPQVGQTLYYQVWYRDPSGPCGNGFNLSQAVGVTWQP